MSNDLNQRIDELEKAYQELHREFTQLRDFVYIDHFFNRLFEKAFQVMCFGGDYIEFGVFRGDSMIQAYQAAERIFGRLASEYWDAGFVDKSKKEKFKDAWENMRFIGFDMFTGMPGLNDIDSAYGMFEEGSFSTTVEECRGNLSSAGVDLNKVSLVPGNFRDTLNPKTATKLELSKLSVVHVDCDLYSSAKMALDFITPYLQDGTVIIFDEWFHYRGNPTLGEQRAFSEWRQANPRLIVTPFHMEGPYRNSFIVSTKRFA